MANWTDVFPAAELQAGVLRTWKQVRWQLVLGLSGAGDAFALDNRCPHEGYPLSQGDLKDATLTCCWHNWKFDVHDGTCRRGGEDVRSYPLRVRDGMLQVDLTPPPAEAEIARLRHSLAAALTDADLDRALRDSVRLLQVGVPVARLLGDVALHDARHAEDGTTHVLALAAETSRLIRDADVAGVARFLAPLLDLAAETNQRLPPRPGPTAAQVRAATASAQALRSAVESEDLDRAEAIVRAAYAQGRSRHEIESWLYGVCSDHFLSFGHALIYLVQSKRLLDLLPEEDAPAVHAALLVHMGTATREDTLPYLRGDFRHLQAWSGEWSRLAAPGRHAAGAVPEAVEAAVLDGTRAQAMAAVQEALRDGWSARQVSQALVLAASRRLLRFDLRLDGDVTVQEGWLFATHRLTFASAVRQALERFDSPAALRFLFQAAAFIRSGAPMDAAEDVPVADAAAAAPDLLAVQRAILERDTSGALGGVAAAVAAQGATAALERMLCATSLDVHLVRPIFRVHAIKTLLAGLDETRALGHHPRRALPLLAAVRFLASPVQEARVAGAAHAAVEWVEHGRMVRKLTQ